jgi:hypothetical protein
LRRLGLALLRAPVLIISMAVLVTVASLFASAWPGPPRTPAIQRTADNSDDGVDSLPAMELIDSAGGRVPLRRQLPAVVLITDGCDCARLVADTIVAVRPEVAVITVGSGPATPRANLTPPTGATPQAQGKTVLDLRDPTGGLRASLRLGEPDGTAAALLVDRDGDIVREFPRTASVEDLRPQLARL